MLETNVITVENGTDLLLTLLYAGGKRNDINEEIVGNTRIVKLLFLLEKETSLKKYLSDFTYDAYNYGPFSSELFDSLQALINANLVNAHTNEFESYLDEADRFQIERQSDNEADSPKTIVRYSLTEDGLIVGKALFDSLSTVEQTELVELKKHFNNISLRKLLQYVYRKYPAYTTESLIKDSI